MYIKDKMRSKISPYKTNIILNSRIFTSKDHQKLNDIYCTGKMVDDNYVLGYVLPYVEFNNLKYLQ